MLYEWLFLCLMGMTGNDNLRVVPHDRLANIRPHVRTFIHGIEQFEVKEHFRKPILPARKPLIDAITVRCPIKGNFYMKQHFYVIDVSLQSPF